MDERIIGAVNARLSSAVVRNKLVSFELRYEDYERFKRVQELLSAGQSQLLRAIVLAYLDEVDAVTSSPSDQEVPK